MSTNAPPGSRTVRLVPVTVQRSQIRGESQPFLRPQRSDDLWFEDGNLIVQVEHLQFKLHRGVLAKHSSAFASLCGLPQPPAQEVLEGCPVVVLFGDSATDAEVFFKALYDKT